VINIKKFQCDVEITARYAVEFDETIINKEWMDNFNRYFFELDTLEDHAKHISSTIAKFGIDSFIEGYGYPKIICYNSQGSPYEYQRFMVSDSDINNAVTVYVMDDMEIEVDTFGCNIKLE